MLWFRFNTEDLAIHGVSACRLFADSDDTPFDAVAAGCAALDWIGVCGWLMDRKRM
jgi:hypothetical protein